jgi:AcrR family transcriptional regulator
MTRGRPREFDPETALDDALAVFARDGFEQASVRELADAMGICKPSLYAAYGNKEGLFVEAVRRYAQLSDARRSEILDGEPDGATALMLLMHDAVARYTECSTTAGCLVVAEAASAPAGCPDTVRGVLGEVLARDRALLERRLLRAQHDGHLAADADIAALTSYFQAVLAGLSVQARSGAPAAELCAVVRTAMGAWATPAGRKPVESLHAATR